MRGPGALAAAALVAALPAGPAAPTGWESFYAGGGGAAGTTAQAPRSGGVSGICIRAILDAQQRHGIPGNILLGIGLQEAGLMQNGELTVWPWAVNSEGAGYHFDTLHGALDFIAKEHARGVSSIDVGCLQINMRWHPDAFDDVRDGFRPEVNADYAARFLKRLYAETGDWQEAAGAYHSRTPEKQAIYRASVLRNIRVANQRIDTFRAMAGGAARHVADAPAPAPLGGPFWSAAHAEGSARRSLFAAGELQPLLPNLRKGN
ncbi:transglycosylase SLT domain-containing protein [Roseivivax isoporae]|uniref:Uncharacterized protein n=1 Tax=Roseivivax isoporae LMG 25204 TaxID=1449351 RepID=X7F7Y5_9RHOB|nr:transglycosylase SLT domain-containing protein [Roseivivax isoporae]ETX28915.1 hypothetical protein RISW2_04170 [Roseivivax isoporae LMG 25204]